MIRLNKLLAERGVAARRKCDVLIAEGRVRVNGRRVTEAGTKVEEGRDRIEVDGRAIAGRAPLRYYVLNKPVGVITTLGDPEGRRTVADMLPPGPRLYPVGRLDADTSGLLLLTNDGELAHRLMHPRYGVVKVYRVRLDREPAQRTLERLAAGVMFEPGQVSAPSRVRRIQPGFDAIMIEVAIHEGRHRQVRRMCEAVGLEVRGLHRVAYGPVRLGPLARGMWRELSEQEVSRLREAGARPVRRPARASAPGARREPARPGDRTGAAPRRGMPPATAGSVGAGGARPSRGVSRPAGASSPPAAPTPWPARAGGRRGDSDFIGPPIDAIDDDPAAPLRATREYADARGPRPGRARGPGRGAAPVRRERPSTDARGTAPARRERRGDGPRDSAGPRARRPRAGGRSAAPGRGERPGAQAGRGPRRAESAEARGRRPSPVTSSGGRRVRPGRVSAGKRAGRPVQFNRPKR